MAAVWTIARRDFFAVFQTLRASSVFFFFLFILGFFFAKFVEMFLQFQQQSAGMGGSTPTLEELMRAIFSNTNFVLIFLIPMVTMSSFSEEKRSHAFRLLQTAPISATQIVLGKFLATAGFLGLLILSSAVYPLFVWYYGALDMGVVASSYLGLFLLVCSYAAFGLWISSMTSSPFIALSLTMLGLLMFFLLSWLVQDGGYFVITEHLDPFFKGLITVSDVVFFLCFICLFLFLTNAVIDSQRWR